MSDRLPAVALAAVPKRRRATLDLAREIEKRGFQGIYCADFGDGLGLCEALALVTSEIPFGTAISTIYTRHPTDYAKTTAFIHELSRGRFRFGIGVGHTSMMRRLGIETGKPLPDTKSFVERWRAMPRTGEQPPLVLASLRDPMVRLAGRIAEGMVFANAARSHMGHSVDQLRSVRSEIDDFFIGNMIPTCISDDVAAAAAVNRRTMTGYVTLPNYREYWRQAGHGEVMDQVEAALEARDRDRLPELLTDEWLADVTIFGPVAHVREQVEAWFDAGVKTPILVPSSAVGNQMVAFEELFAAFS